MSNWVTIKINKPEDLNKAMVEYVAKRLGWKTWENARCRIVAGPGEVDVTVEIERVD
jgi:hypothetical protein